MACSVRSTAQERQILNFTQRKMSQNKTGLISDLSRVRIKPTPNLYSAAIWHALVPVGNVYGKGGGGDFSPVTSLPFNFLFNVFIKGLTYFPCISHSAFAIQNSEGKKHLFRRCQSKMVYRPSDGNPTPTTHPPIPPPLLPPSAPSSRTLPLLVSQLLALINLKSWTLFLTPYAAVHVHADEDCVMRQWSNLSRRRASLWPHYWLIKSRASLALHSRPSSVESFPGKMESQIL